MEKQKRDWKSLVREHERSGLSVKDFCLQKRLSVSGFYQNRKRVNELPAFLPALVEDSSDTQCITFRKGQVTIEVPLTASSTLISSLLTALTEAPC